MKKIIILGFTLLILGGCNFQQKFIYLKLIPESSVHIEEAKIAVCFFDENNQEIKVVKRDIFPYKKIRVWVPKGASSYSYYSVRISYTGPELWFTGCYQKWDIAKNKSIVLHANNPVSGVTLKESIDNEEIEISWEAEEYADMYYLNFQFRNEDNFTIHKLGVLVPNNLCAFDIKKIPFLIEKQNIDLTEAIKERRLFVIGELPEKDFKKVFVNIDAILIDSKNELQSLTYAYNSCEIELKKVFFEK